MKALNLNSNRYIFAFNILKPYFDNFGVSHYTFVNKMFKKNVNDHHLLPLVNHENNSIEKRAKNIDTEISKVNKKINKSRIFF